MKSGSLRLRVTLSVTIALAVVLVALVVVIDALFGQQTVRDETNLIRDRVQLARQLEKQRLSPEQLYTRLSIGGLISVRITAPSGLVAGTKNVEPAATPPPVTVTYRNGIKITFSADAETKPQANLRRLLVIVGVCALVVTAFGLIFLVRFALRPLDHMATLARSIAGGDRGRRLAPERTDTEIGSTAEAFDNMLDELEGAELKARNAEQRTRQFVADAAHELRTPVAGLQAVAESVLQQNADTDPEERDRMLLLLVRESRRAGRLVDDLLALARIDAGLDLQHEPVDLRHLADAEADRTRVLAPELAVAVDGPSVVVPGDPQRLAQVLANLMNNARQASGGQGHITLSVGAAGGFAHLVVADDGPGVPDAERERIFDRLVRLDEARASASGGSGLGLPIARGICRAHGGDLACEAPPPGHRGAVFRITLPLPDQLDAPTIAFAPIAP
ncbi:cell wall metabolism sensor histidine kinase WalK [Kutzneria buriramensis]|uniref:histidine kinase n=1 Tax=Kutzneria buriramensis TaxID=1045776 RepID=A0A3E0HC83_9PSEU|nr:HAMP domain-containing sensor histidine kinase [Kutzneria buriramensis]REH42056.1 signal transduction histidine kinase [Kutzneria buriramensis]